MTEYEYQIGIYKSTMDNWYFRILSRGLVISVLSFWPTREVCCEEAGKELGRLLNSTAPNEV